MHEIDISEKVSQISEQLTQFIASYAEEKGTECALIWYSGYIDSTTITKLTIEALGKEAIKLMVRTDKFSNIQENIFETSIDFLGLNKDNLVKCDIESIIKKIGAETLIPGSLREVPLVYEPLTYSLLKHSTVIDEGKTYGMIGKATSGREELIHKVIAYNKLRSRVHMAFAYLTAEIENRFLIGTINKSELLTGLFTKWGKGHSADIMPLGNLYRSQIIQLADYLQIPESITSLAKADLLPGIENKYMYFFDLSALEVDQILIGLETGLSLKQITTKTGIPLEKVEKVNTYFISSQYARKAPVIPKI